MADSESAVRADGAGYPRSSRERPYRPGHARGPAAPCAVLAWGWLVAQRRRVLLAAGPLLAVWLMLHVYLAGGRYVSTDNAYVHSDTVAVSTDVAGPVVEVFVRENQSVGAGQPLFRIDPEPYRIALTAAQAQLAAARSEIHSLQADYRQRLAEIGQAQTDLAFSERQLARERELAQRSVASRAGLDSVQHDAESALQHLEALREQAQVALARLGGRPDAPVESYARFLGAQAQADRAQRELVRTLVLAPFGGVVAHTERLQLGQLLAAAQPALTLVASQPVWVEANLKETDLTYLRAGAAATVTVDAYPGQEWPATVSGLSPATGSEFAVLPAQNASGNWVKVVQRVPVRLSVELPADAPPLRAGLSAQVRIDTGHRRSLAALLRGASGWPGS